MSLGTFKWQLDEHHPALLRHFASLALLYKALDLLTYLRTMFYSVHSGVTQICYGELTRCLFMENTVRMCNKKCIFGTLMIIETVLDYYDLLVYMYNTHPD